MAARFKVSVASVVEVVAAVSRDLSGRLAEKPDITLRALGAELAARGIKVSHFAVWHFFEHEGISFKKKPADHGNGIGRLFHFAQQQFMRPDVRMGSKGDISTAKIDVRFTPKSGHGRCCR